MYTFLLEFFLALSLYLSLCVSLSLYLSMILLTRCQDHVLPENIWFVCQALLNSIM